MRELRLSTTSLPCRSPRPVGRLRVARLRRPAEPIARPVTLRVVADSLGLSPATISLVLNRAPAAAAIPRETHERVQRAARELGYRPNSVARSLRQRKSFTVGVMVPEISEGYAALVMGGIEDHLLREGWLYFVASHRHRDDLVTEYPRLLLDRAIEGLIAVDTPCRDVLPVPVVAVSGHEPTPGVTNVVLNHTRAGLLALEHLAALGHRRLAFLKGQVFSSDTAARWGAIVQAARRLGLSIEPARVEQLQDGTPTPEPGYQATRRLLARAQDFTALFAFNDISAMGAIRALREAGHRVPEAVSVVGFDDVQSAAFHHPPLTTVRQPLRRMGELAAEILLRRIAGGPGVAAPKRVMVEPELVVRDSSMPAPGAA